MISSITSRSIPSSTELEFDKADSVEFESAFKSAREWTRLLIGPRDRVDCCQHVVYRDGNIAMKVSKQKSRA